jgi:hypothetical protein
MITKTSLCGEEVEQQQDYAMNSAEVKGEREGFELTLSTMA